MATISLENIDTLTKWRVKFERPTVKEAPLWLEVKEQPEHVHWVGGDLDDPSLLGVRHWSNGRTLEFKTEEAYEESSSSAYT